MSKRILNAISFVASRKKQNIHMYIGASSLDDETDRRFWAETGYKVGQKLNMSIPQDKTMAQKWLLIRDQVELENRQAAEDATKNQNQNATMEVPVGTYKNNIPSDYYNAIKSGYNATVNAFNQATNVTPNQVAEAPIRSTEYSAPRETTYTPPSIKDNEPKSGGGMIAGLVIVLGGGLALAHASSKSKG